MIINIIIALVIISLVVIVHEFGHFIVAKANGVTVVEFAIGFGPSLIHFKKGETEYSLKLIPFGGACVMLGDDLLAEPVSKKDADEEDADEEDADEEASDKGFDGENSYDSGNDKNIGDNSADNSDNVNEIADNRKNDKKKLIEGVYDESKSFANKSVWSRIAIIAAGPLFNFLLAFIGALIVVSSVGVDLATIDDVEAGSSAAEAGLMAGDRIVGINGDSVTFSKEYSFYEYYHSDKTWEITYIRDGNKNTATVKPEYKTEEVCRIGVTVVADSDGSQVRSVADDSPAKAAGLEPGDVITVINGVELNETVDITDVIKDCAGKSISVEFLRNNELKSTALTPARYTVEGYYSGISCYGIREKVSGTDIVVYAVKEAGCWIETVVKSVGMMFTGKIGLDSLSGPVGVIDSVSQVVEESRVDGAYYLFLTLVNYVVMLSANLGVMNLLPLPALDGGRLLFLIIEVLRGKPVKKEHEGMVHFIGMVLLMLLMVYILCKDIINLF